MARGATVVFTNPAVYITTSTVATSTHATDAYDVSTWFRQITLDISADEKEDTTFGLTAKSRVQGLFDWGFQSEAIQDYASTGIGTAKGLDNVMYDLLNNKIKFNVFVRPANAAISSDNPEYGGPVRLFSHRPVGGAIGDVLMTPLSFKGSGNFARRIV
jgi:hypothetical protein